MEVMLDLETFSTRGNAAILIIAAIKFNRDEPIGKIEKTDNFYAKISLESCKKVNLHVDSKTVHWWENRDPETKKDIFSEPREELKSVLLKFNRWFGKAEKIWSHGASFDVPILSEAYYNCSLEPPWKFWNIRDTRTIFDLVDMNIKDFPQDNLHNALHDCWRQIYGLQQCFKKIKVN
jgi:hypothetical protein